MLFTETEAELIRSSMPVLSDRPPGVDIVGKLEKLFSSSQDIKSDQAVVPSGDTSVTVVNPALAGFSGSVAVASLNEVDGTIGVQSVAWAGDNLVITLTGPTTADRVVSWMIDGRAAPSVEVLPPLIMF